MSKKKSFVFYHSYNEALKDMSDSEKGQLLQALMDYAIEDIEPPKSSPIRTAFNFIKIQLDIDRKKWEEKANISRKNGTRGGRPRKVIEDEKTQQNPVGLKKPVDVEVDVEVDVDVKKDLEYLKTNKKEIAKKIEKEEEFKKYDALKAIHAVIDYCEANKKQYEDYIAAVRGFLRRSPEMYKRRISLLDQMKTAKEIVKERERMAAINNS